MEIFTKIPYRDVLGSFCAIVVFFLTLLMPLWYFILCGNERHDKNAFVEAQRRRLKFHNGQNMALRCSDDGL